VAPGCPVRAPVGSRRRPQRVAARADAWEAVTSRETSLVSKGPRRTVRRTGLPRGGWHDMHPRFLRLEGGSGQSVLSIDRIETEAIGVPRRRHQSSPGKVHAAPGPWYGRFSVVLTGDSAPRSTGAAAGFKDVRLRSPLCSRSGRVFTRSCL
jgi:hypothetical protein